METHTLLPHCKKKETEAQKKKRLAQGYQESEKGLEARASQTHPRWCQGQGLSEDSIRIQDIRDRSSKILLKVHLRLTSPCTC